MKAKNRKVTLFEVGPRDGLQNENRPLALNDKVSFIQNLLAAGVKDVEVGAFVREDKVPQMANSEALVKLIAPAMAKIKGGRAYALVANEKGLDRAIVAGVKHIAIFTAATDGFNKKNIGRSVEQSLKEYQILVKRAHRNQIKVRGYVSTVFGCPYEGPVKPAQAMRVIDKLANLGVEQISIGDTIGVATPSGVRKIMKQSVREFGGKRIAGHFHDTRGTALTHVWISYEEGVRTFDSSAGGLGGCPYAPGATGNVATEDLIALFHSEGIETGLSLPKIASAAKWILSAVGREPQSRVLRAYFAEYAANQNQGNRPLSDDMVEKITLKKFFRYTTPGR